MSIYMDCDIRGTYGDDLDEEVIARIGGAVAIMLEGRPIVVGGDFRTHTPQLKGAFVEALLAAGAHVIDVGQVSTPQLYFSKRHLDVYASAQVTASHNPPQYNGVKLMFGDAPALADTINRVRDLAEAGEFPQAEGTYEQVDTTEDYVAMLVERFGEPLDAAAGQSLRIVCDAGNGAMSPIAPRVLEACGLDVIPLFCEPDGRFPNRNPNPALAEATVKLSAAVLEHGADLGVAFDGDGDRAIYVDAEGRALIAEESMVIFANALANAGDSVVYDLKCSTILKSAIEARGARPIMERSGHGFIRTRLIGEPCVFGGEVSGHYFFNELCGDDGLYATVVLARILADARAERPGCGLRDLLADVRYTSITPDIRIRSTPEECDAALDVMRAWCAEEGVEPVTVDGLRLERADGSWVLVRKSITEPAYTVRLEAPTAEGLAALRREAAERLGQPSLAE